MGGGGGVGGGGRRGPKVAARRPNPVSLVSFLATWLCITSLGLAIRVGEAVLIPRQAEVQNQVFVTGGFGVDPGDIAGVGSTVGLEGVVVLDSDDEGVQGMASGHASDDEAIPIS